MHVQLTGQYKYELIRWVSPRQDHELEGMILPAVVARRNLVKSLHRDYCINILIV